MELRHTIDVADIAEIIFALINEETHHLAAIQPRNDISLASGKDNEPPAALPTTRTQEQLAISPMVPPAEVQHHLVQNSKSNEQLHPWHTRTARQTTPTPTAPLPVSPSYSKAASKNKRRQCCICPCFDMHPQWHIDSKHPHSFQSKPEKLVHVHKHDKLTRDHHNSKNVRQFQDRPAQSLVKLLGMAAEKTLTQNEFLAVQDYLLLTKLYKNGSRPGPLENT